MTSLVFLLDSAAINGPTPEPTALRAVGRQVAVRYFINRGNVRPTVEQTQTPGFGPFPPIVIYGPIAFGGPGTRLTQPAASPRDRRAPDSRLFPPAVVRVPIAFYGPGVVRPRVTNRSLVRRAPLSHLSPPAVVARPAYGGPSIRLVDPSTRLGRKPKSFLRAPVVAASVSVVFPGPRVSLAPSRAARTPKPVLFKPVVPIVPTAVFSGPETKLAYSRRGKAKPFLLRVPPAFQPFPGVEPKLAPSRRGKTKPQLFAPKVVQAFLVPVVSTYFVRIRPARTNPELRPPTTIDLRPRVYSVETHLAYSRRGTTKSTLRPPVIPPLAPPVREELAVQLARARFERRLAVSRLAPPAVIDNSPQVVYLTTWLTYSLHGKPKPRLFPPTDLVDQQDLGFVRTHLTYSRHGRPLSHLSAPTVVAPVLARAILTHLAPSSQGISKSVLREPAVVAPVLARPINEEIAVNLAKSERPQVHSRLSPPTVVSPFVARPITVGLARIRPAQVHAVLGRPTDLVDQQDIGYLRAHLAASRRGAPKSFLRPMGGPAVAYAPIRVDLVRIRPVRTVAELRPPTVIDLSPQTKYLSVNLTYGVRGVPKSSLGTPADLIDRQDLGFVLVHLSYSRRGRPIYRLAPPTAVGPVLARAIEIHLAPSFHGLPKSVLREPAVVSPVLARPISATLKRIRPKPTTYRLFQPAVVTGHVPEDVSVDVTLAYQSRGKPKSVVRPPAVVAPVLARAISATLVRIRPRPTTDRLFPPVVVYLAVELSGPETSLAPSRRGTPKPALFPPIHPETFPPVSEEIAVQLTEASLIRRRPKSVLFPPQVVFTAVELSGPEVTLAPQKRGVPRPKLFQPAVVGPVLARAIDITLAPQRRGIPKSALRPATVVSAFSPRPIQTTLARIRPQRTHSQVAPPFVIAAANGPQGGIGIWLAPSFRGTPKSKLSAPTVVSISFFAAPIQTHLTRAPQTNARRSKSFLIQVVYDGRVYPGIEGFLAKRKHVAPPVHSRLSAPTVIDNRPQTVYLDVHLSPSRRGIPKSFLGKPTDTVGVEDQGRVNVHLTRIRPVRTNPVLAPPTVIDNSPQTVYLATWLTYSRRGIPKPRLFPPTDLVDQQDLGSVATSLAYSRRGAPKPKLFAPAVVGPVLARPVRVALARIRPQTTHSTLHPAIIPPLPRPVEEELSVQLTRATLERRTISKLGAPTVVYAFRVPFVATHLTRIRPVRTSHVLAPPQVVFTAVELSGPETTLAPSFRGTPKSFLSPPVPAETFPPVHEEIAVQLALVEVRQRKTTSRLSPPVVVFTAVELSGPETALALSSRGKTKYFLRAMGAPAVVYAPLETRLAPSTRLPRAPHSRLAPPTVIDNRPQTFYVTVSLAYSLRGKAKPRLAPPPAIQATAKAETVVQVTLAYSLRGTPRSRIAPPVVVTAATPYLRPIDVTLARIRPVKTQAVLVRPADTVGLEDQGSVQVTLAASFRGRPKPKLSAPTAVFAFVGRPISVELVRIRPAATRYVLRRPTDLVDQQDIGFVNVQLAYSRRGRPVYRLAAPTVVGPVLARALDVTLAPQLRGVPKSRYTGVVYDARSYAPISTTLAPSFRGKAKPFLPETVYVARSYAPVRVVLAPSTRIDRTPHSRLEQPAVVAPVLARAIAVTLAPQTRGQAKPFLPQTIYEARSYAQIRVLLAPSTRLARASKSFIAPPTVVSAFTARPVVVALAPQPRRPAMSRLENVVYEARSYAPVKVVLAASPRIDRTPHSRLSGPTVVGTFTARPVSVTLAPQPKSKTSSFLTRAAAESRVHAAIRVWLAPAPRIDRAPHSRLYAPTVVTPFFARHIVVALARTPRIPIHQFLSEPILAVPGFPGPTVTLARIRPHRTVAHVVPPAVVNPYVAPVATFLSVTLAYSVRGRPIHHLGFVPGLSHGGIVCGVILDLTSVCQDITADADTIIDGGVLETHVVSEETTASTVIMGETLAETQIDQEIE